MRFTTSNSRSGWDCEYEIDDKTGKLLSVGCCNKNWGPPGTSPFEEGVGTQSTAGEENQADEADEWESA